jgi:Cys-tRNA(Pro)/Cys-tRNA(Cys) deacylase
MRTPYNSAVAQKTNAARLLDQLGIRYELREYEIHPDDLAAEPVAAKIGLPAEQVFKTLVARGDRNGICLAIIPGDQELDLKALAAAAGERKIQLVPVKELQTLTGYIRGGVTALAAKRDFPVFVDETIELFDVVSISAGIRGFASSHRTRGLSERGERCCRGPGAAEETTVIAGHNRRTADSSVSI